MGSCLSKKSACSSSAKSIALPENPQEITKPNVASSTQLEKKKPEEECVKKEVFVIKHRKSHEVDRRSDEEKGEVKKAVNEVVETGKSVNGLGNVVGGVAAQVRTSSCTKEEVDAILIQCGRLSRSSSTGKAGLSGSSENASANFQKGRKYSGSKRSYDFDSEANNSEGRENVGDEDVVVVAERDHRHRQRHRSRGVGSPSKGRRRTPSREREQGTNQQQQRSGSRERGSGSGGRRVSRSPGRRSESPITTNSSGGGNLSANGNGGTGKPGKMVSVPATVSSLAMDKSTNANESISASAIKRIQVKRNVGSADATAGSRTAASPRARSPARANRENQNQQQPLSLSRSNSRKAENSPYRRNPLSEIDTNAANNIMPQASMKKMNADNISNSKAVVQGTDNKISSNKGSMACNVTYPNCKSKEEQQQMEDETKGLQPASANVGVNVIAAGSDALKPHLPTRTRSSRLSRDLDIAPEALTNATPSYTALLLEDIQNFHQKSTPPSFTLPACVTKAQSILEAVADLNSSTGSTLSSAFSEDKRRNHSAETFRRNDEKDNFGYNLAADKKRLGTKEPFVESEVVAADDLMEPSFHKYVTLRRGTAGVGDMEETESSGSNSFVGGQPQWMSSSSWEPNSADSTDCWTSSRSNGREDERSPLAFQRSALSEPGHDMLDAARWGVSGKKEGYDQQQNGIGRGRLGPKGLYAVAPTAATAST